MEDDHRIRVCWDDFVAPVTCTWQARVCLAQIGKSNPGSCAKIGCPVTLW